jgi:hypothetical protein
MMETRLLARLLASARTVTALGAITAAREAGADASGLVRAQVAARLPDGTFRVLVGGKPLELALPAGVRTGDVIELRLLNRQAAPGAHVRDASASADGALSATARVISSLLSQAPGAPPRQARPVLDLPPSASAELPEPLARAVERSGMFYESHQARWVEGDYPLERLLQEPQAALGRNRAEAAEGQHAARAPQELGPASLPARAAMPVPDSAAKDAAFSERVAAADAQPIAARADDDAQAQAPARETLPLIRHQLEALDSRHIAWLGEIWPGQSMRWEIGQEDAGAREADRDGGWNTRFSLELPALGEVEADLALGAGGVRLNLEVKSVETEALMRSCTAELAQAFATAGVGQVHLKVSRDDAAA